MKTTEHYQSATRQTDLAFIGRYKLPLSLAIQRWNVDAFRNVDAVCQYVDVFQRTLDA